MEHNDRASIDRRVAKGIDLFTKHRWYPLEEGVPEGNVLSAFSERPNLFDRVDLVNLEMISSCDCILGHVGRPVGLDFHQVRDQILGFDSWDCIDHGFQAMCTNLRYRMKHMGLFTQSEWDDEQDLEYGMLEVAWKSAITAMRMQEAAR